MGQLTIHNSVRCLFVAVPVVLLLSLTGCNAIKGLGTDIHDVAQHTQLFIEDTTGYTTDTRTPSPSAKSRYNSAATSVRR